jgi:hypothetical protein
MQGAQQQVFGRGLTGEPARDAFGERLAHGLEEPLHGPDHHRPCDRVTIGKVLVQRPDAGPARVAIARVVRLW